ncbi:protein C10-like isoform X2 [Pomacea canaliculata]|uniref:protein C10-like isoform X2 n=1 Tax=Pomacea canaliculata TaxID=400727 RepID=UPI000D73E2BD|nr:protein C10-like isoform X2 [Pomacea canaliculata]
MATAMQQFTLEDCKALSDVLEAFKLPENATRLNEAHDNAGNDMLKSMQIVFPVLAQIQMEVIHKYGFMADGDGLVQFTKAVRVYETQDTEVASLNQELRGYLMPPVGISPPAAMGQNGAS